MKNLTDKLECQYRELQDGIDQLGRGECKPADVKKLSAPFGIYAERDGNYMMRVRLLNGEISGSEMDQVCGIMRRYEIPAAHFSSRCNIQLHGVPPDSVAKVLLSFADADMVFKGGGGNTFRSIAGPPCTGVSPGEAFDVTPYMRAVWDYIFSYEKAYELGRKFKLAFSSSLSDESCCYFQDLGLIAHVKDGRRGFRIVGGGGLGRGADAGIELLSFLPAERALQAVVAAIDLFHEHGNRENRSKARLRFLRQKLGDESFRELYLETLDKTEAPLLQDLAATDYHQVAANLKVFDDPQPQEEGFAAWRIRSVRETSLPDICSVKLYMRNGVFSADDLSILSAVLKELGTPCIRLTSQQDALIPLVHASALRHLYRAVCGGLNGMMADGKFAEHVVSCIGASRCSMGLVDAPSVAMQLGQSLDHLFESYPDLRDELYEEIIDGIRISGCGSSCSRNQIAAIGLSGHRMKIDGVLTDTFFVHIGGYNSELSRSLAESSPDWWIKVSDAPSLICALVRKYLDHYRAGKEVSFCAFMKAKCPAFSPSDYL